MLGVAHYQTLLNLYPKGLLVLDQGGAVFEANDKAKEILGQDPQGQCLEEILSKKVPHEGSLEIGPRTFQLRTMSFPCPEEKGFEPLKLVILEPNTQNEADTWLERILNALPEVITIGDSQGHIFFSNKASLDFNTKRIQPGSVTEPEREVLERIEQGISEHEEVEKFYDLCGSKILRRIVFEPVFYLGSRKILRISRDITRLETILDNLQEGLAVMDSEGHYYYLNPAIETLTGIPRAELMEKGWRRVSPEIERYVPMMQRIEQGFSGYEETEQALTLSSSRRVFRRIVMTPIFYAGAQRVLSAIQDITPLKEAQEELDFIFENTRAAIALTDKQGRWTRINRTFAEDFGYSREELLGRTTKEQPCTTEETLKVLHELWAYAIKQKEETPRPFDVPWKHKDGSVIVHSAYETPFGKEGEARLYTAVDITELREAQATLNALVEAQQQTIKELSTPIIPVWTKVLMAPMLGSFDSMRMHDLSERLLEEASRKKPTAVLLDLSGLAYVDTQVVSEVVRLIASVRLLGTRTVLSGISPQIAQSLVRLGVNLENVPTFATLEQALKGVIEAHHG